MRKRTQADHVIEDQGIKAREVTEKVNLPGAANLHEKPAEEIAEILAIALRMKKDVIALSYHIDNGINLTFRP